MSDELVGLFKALADANRLKILGLLSQQPYSGEELAALLKLKPSTVSHHLSKLAEVGLVSTKDISPTISPTPSWAILFSCASSR